jgi:DNA polymerase III subunit delta'
MQELLPWHAPYWQQLQRYLQSQRLPQALLMTGRAGLGKQRLAGQFAAALLCGQRLANGMACGHCRDCRLGLAETHPNLLTLALLENKTAIVVDQIRNVIAQATLKPQFDGYRVIIVNPADALNTHAANAFLKFLEEPTGRTLLLLITDAPGKLPATIISRCQKMTLSAPEFELSHPWLQQQAELDANQAERLLQLAQGSPLQALTYARQGALTVHDLCFQNWLQLAKQQTHAVLVAETWQKWPDLPLLSWFASWLIDLLKCSYKINPANLYNPGLYPDLLALSQQRIDRRKVFILYDLALANLQRQHTTINKQLMFEELLIQWSQLNRNQ